MSGDYNVACLVYLHALDSPVQSQVITPMRLLAEHEPPASLVLFRSVRSMLERQRRAGWKALRADLIRSYPGVVRILPAAPRRLRLDWDAPLLTGVLRRITAGGAPLILHCRGPNAAALGLAARSTCPAVRVVYEARGLYGHEQLYEAGYSERDELPVLLRNEFERRVALENRCVEQADGVVFVSEEMRSHFSNRVGLSDKAACVVPCCVDGSRFGQGRTQREEMRSALGFGDELVVVYCGSIHRWQCPEASIEAFKTMHQVVTNSRLLILTRQTERMLTLLREKGVEPEAYTVTTVPHADVPSYLAAADVGLLLREPSVVNRVAAPIKFAEYAAAGVPVLISDGVGDYSDHVRKEKLGLIEGGDDNGFVDWLQDVRAHRSAWAERCAAFAERELAWQSRIADVVDFHRALAAQDMTTHD